MSFIAGYRTGPQGTEILCGIEAKFCKGDSMGVPWS